MIPGISEAIIFPKEEISRLKVMLMILFRNMREYAAVGAWALIAIAVRHWGDILILQWTALICAILLILAISVHGYRMRKTNPFFAGRMAQ